MPGFHILAATYYGFLGVGVLKYLLTAELLEYVRSLRGVAINTVGATPTVACDRRENTAA